MSSIITSLASSRTSFYGTKKGFQNKQRILFKFSSNWEYLLITVSCTYTIQNIYSFAVVSQTCDEPTIIHHIICFLLVGLPLNYLQLLTGQYSQLGGIYFKHMCPIGHGVGYAMLLNSFVWCCNFGMMMADFLMYLLASIDTQLNWMNCPPNTTKSCWDSSSNCTRNCITSDIAPSAYVYWKEIYMNNPDLDPKHLTLGKPIFARAVPLFLTWSLIFVFVSMGINKYIKILRLNFYMISIFVVILILVCFITEGSATGVAMMFNIRFESLFSAAAWSDAIFNVVKSLALARTCHVTYGSYMTPTMPSDILTIFGVFLNFFATLLGSVITHATLGIIMAAAGVKGDKEHLQYIWKTGRAPYFSVIPQGLGFLGVPQLWSVIYFLICICVVVNNLITQTDLIERTIADAHTRIRVYRNYMLATFCIVCAFVGLIESSTEGFMLVEELYNNVMANVRCFVIMVMSVLAFWIYRVQRISDDIHFLQGSQPTKFWKIFWYGMPCMLGFACCYTGFLDRSKIVKPVFRTFHTLAYFILISPIPVFMCYEILRHLKTHNLVGILQPEERWGPPDPLERHLRHLFNPRQEIRSRRRDDTCQHNCLLANKHLRKVVDEEMQLRYLFFEAQVKINESRQS